MVHCTLLPLLALLSTAPQRPIHNQNRSSITPVYGRYGTYLKNDYALVRHSVFSIKHRPGKKHANADALSRCAHAEEPDPDDEPDEMIAMIHEMIKVLEPVCPRLGPCPHPLSTADGF
jgi:hypothetical protein